MNISSVARHVFDNEYADDDDDFVEYLEQHTPQHDDDDSGLNVINCKFNIYIYI